jgi:predicted metalloendopeptidase
MCISSWGAGQTLACATLRVQQEVHLEVNDDDPSHSPRRLSLGENIGDLGGLTLAYDAWRLHLAEEGTDPPVLDGFTGDQRFFLAWAQLWRTLMTPEFQRQLALSDPHSPGEFRVNGIVRNHEPWYGAFGVTPDADLYLPPEMRADIW